MMLATRSCPPPPPNWMCNIWQPGVSSEPMENQFGVATQGRCLSIAARVTLAKPLHTASSGHCWYVMSITNDGGTRLHEYPPPPPFTLIRPPVRFLTSSLPTPRVFCFPLLKTKRMPEYTGEGPSYTFLRLCTVEARVPLLLFKL